MKKEINKTHKSAAKPAHKSPRIYRFFSEWYIYPITFSIILALVATILGLKYLQLHKELQRVEGERGQVVKEIEFWEKVVKQYRDYRDAYFKLALLYYRLDNTKKAQENVDKSLELDPNFEKGRELKELLE